MSVQLNRYGPITRGDQYGSGKGSHTGRAHGGGQVSGPAAAPPGRHHGAHAGGPRATWRAARRGTPVKPYTRSHSWRKGPPLPSRAVSAAYGNWRHRVHAWERREQYRTGCTPTGTPYRGMPLDRAAHHLDVTIRTIERWRDMILRGEHVHPGPWQGP